MNYVDVQRDGSQAVVRLSRGKVNALNEAVVNGLREQFGNLERDDAIHSVVLTGSGAFFSFGFDIPGLYDHSRKAFTAYLVSFTELYKYLFLYPKPLVAAVNGHAIAGGCMLATACDYRVMVGGKAKISLNEIVFGSTVFQVAVELLRYWVGSRTAQEILLTGDMYNAEEAKQLGLVDEVATPDNLLERAGAVAKRFGKANPASLAHMKQMLRQPVLDHVSSLEQESIKEFVDIWYSDTLRENLRKIEIRD